ncbi:uncharacterized protein LOC143356612 isoform X2 [Halictus rubicundus]|uniref:uncharacterized protein LOC143356612 isoform X2 n=1 Tax=Halictus rubicundus TaxID=77578 RepID=UPI0040374E63
MHVSEIGSCERCGRVYTHLKIFSVKICYKQYTIQRTRDLIVKSMQHRKVLKANLGKCKESKSFTSVLDRLELDAELEARNEIPLRRTSDAQTEPSDDVEQELYSVNARDVLPCRQVLHHPDILYFQGVRYPPEDIASFWKKDSRMWLWKSIRLMRRRNEFIATKTCGTNNETEEAE